MIQFPEQKEGKEPSRNRPCPCGSGKKYKNCCLPKKEFLKNRVDLTMMLQLLYCLIKGLKATKDKTGGPGAKEYSILITKRTLEALPPDWQEQLNIQPVMINNLPTYKVSIKEEKKSVILTPDNRIRMPNDN